MKKVNWLIEKDIYDRESEILAELQKQRYIYQETKYSGSQKSEVCPMPYALCPMPYALCPVVPHLSEKGYISIFAQKQLINISPLMIVFYSWEP